MASRLRWSRSSFCAAQDAWLDCCRRQRMNPIARAPSSAMASAIHAQFEVLEEDAGVTVVVDSTLTAGSTLVVVGEGLVVVVGRMMIAVRVCVAVSVSVCVVVIVTGGGASSGGVVVVAAVVVSTTSAVLVVVRASVRIGVVGSTVSPASVEAGLVGAGLVALGPVRVFRAFSPPPPQPPSTNPARAPSAKSAPNRTSTFSILALLISESSSGRCLAAPPQLDDRRRFARERWSDAMDSDPRAVQALMVQLDAAMNAGGELVDTWAVPRAAQPRESDRATWPAHL